MLFLLILSVLCARELPHDPFQRVAIKALRGDYGQLRPWQKAGYASGLAQGVTVQGTAWVTSYYPAEGFRRGKATRSGIGVSERSAAVTRDTWYQRRGQWVWTQSYGIRVVEDTGANFNRAAAHKHGASIWLDYWWPVPHNRNPVTAYAFIGRP